MAFTSRTVTATYLNPDDSPATGSVTASLSATMANGADGVPCIPSTATLDGSGTATWTLLANDDSGTTPAGTFYSFDERIDGASIHVRSCVIPHAGYPATVDLLTLPEV